MTTHHIEPTRKALHGKFSRELPPALVIEPGDSVIFRTLHAGWGMNELDMSGDLRKFEPRDPELDSGHALCGPIFIRGAEPGMVLEVRIDSILPGSYGWTGAGGWDSVFNRRLGLVDAPESPHRWTLDAETMTGRNHLGHQVKLRPFMGVMGMPPDEPGYHSTGPPRVTGGNIDCKELIAGSSLFLPIAVPGGLFSVGDGHAAQGDGEVCGTAIECPMERVELTFRLHREQTLITPRARTTGAWLTFGFHEDLTEATYLALEDMLGLMGERFRLSRQDALALGSIVVDLRITQIVNGVCGVHAVLSDSAVL